MLLKKIFEELIFFRRMNEIEVDRSQSPGTPPPPPAPTEDGLLSPTTESRDEETPNRSRGKKRHRRAKGKKKKQKTNLMITNEDGTNSTDVIKKQKKVFLRPSTTNNPLLNAPKNSTQFIMDDHENSNLFWNFESNRCNESSKEDIESVGDESNEALEAAMKAGGDDDSYWTAYLERDFESVYETAHQEEIYSWNRTRIIEEISTLEKRQKQLIEMLSQIDPMIYLQKLQHELLALQEQNKQLRMINVAEKVERDKRQRKGSSSPRMPDSTTLENSDTDDDSSSDSEDDDSDGGCSSGCALVRDEAEERLQEVDNDDNEESVDSTDDNIIPPVAEDSESVEACENNGDNDDDTSPIDGACGDSIDDIKQ